MREKSASRSTASNEVQFFLFLCLLFAACPFSLPLAQRVTSSSPSHKCSPDCHKIDIAYDFWCKVDNKENIRYWFSFHKESLHKRCWAGYHKYEKQIIFYIFEDQVAYSTLVI